jgi:TP901-1 family phage major tail protein
MIYQIVIPDFGRIEGPFQLTSLEYRGDHAGEVTFEMAFESAGPMTFAAL